MSCEGVLVLLCQGLCSEAAGGKKLLASAGRVRSGSDTTGMCQCQADMATQTKLRDLTWLIEMRGLANESEGLANRSDGSGIEL